MPCRVKQRVHLLYQHGNLPIICPDGQHLAGFVHLWWPIKFYHGLFQDGRRGYNIGNSLTADTITLQLLLDSTIVVSVLSMILAFMIHVIYYVLLL